MTPQIRCQALALLKALHMALQVYKESCGATCRPHSESLEVSKGLEDPHGSPPTAALLHGADHRAVAEGVQLQRGAPGLAEHRQGRLPGLAVLTGAEHGAEGHHVGPDLLGAHGLQELQRQLPVSTLPGQMMENSPKGP